MTGSVETAAQFLIVWESCLFIVEKKNPILIFLSIDFTKFFRLAALTFANYSIFSISLGQRPPQAFVMET